MAKVAQDIRRSARISENGRYRYWLTREWGPLHRSRNLTFVMLNPSTADANLDDPTIRRCMGFARRDGYDGITVVNLYAFRATKPDEMLATLDPVGPANDSVLEAAFWLAEQDDLPVVAAWGVHAEGRRVYDVMGLPLAAQRMHSFGVTKYGAPRHPLYVKGTTELAPWPPP